MIEEKYWEIWDNITEVRFGSVYDNLDYADKAWEGPSYDEPDIADEEHDDGEEYEYDDEDVDLIMGDAPKADIGSTVDGSDERNEHELWFGTPDKPIL